MWNVLVGWMRTRADARRRSRVTPEDARERARRGASFLDETLPGWWRDVDHFALDLASDGACVLGFLHGSFRLGLARSGVFNVTSAPRASFSPVDLGFFCIPRIEDALQERDYELLNQAWRVEISLRQASATPTDESARREHTPIHRPQGDGAITERLPEMEPQS